MTDNTAKKYNSADYKESNFGIRNQEDLVHIFNVLRNKMYTNKILAVLREYSTNACDAHIESDQRDRPIEVTLPTIAERVLSIRDYGTGLSEDDIRNIYTMYGASTKRGSSELNGQLGFGSKAAFSYTDNYTIISYHEGEKVVYEAYVDETGLGAISEIQREDTLEPSGIEIRINVQSQDINSFHETALKLYKYFKVTPNVKNLEDETIESPTYKLRGSTWGLREDSRYRYRNSHDNMAVMGNVAYPINEEVLHDNLKQSSNWARYDSLLNCPIDFFIPVGGVSIAASREALEYDKKTLRAFQSYFDTAIKEITEEFTSRISHAEDIVEAKKYYKLLMHGELSALNDIVEGTGLTWNDQQIDSYQFNIPEINIPATEDTASLPAFIVKTVEPINTTAAVKQIQRSAGNSFEVNDDVKLFYQDTSDKPILRLRKFFQDNPSVKKVFVFKIENESTTIEQIAEASGVPRKYFTNLSTQAALVVDTNRAAGPHNIKHSRKVFQFVPTPAAGSGFADSRFWDPATVDADEEYCYVFLNRFEPSLTQQGASISNQTFNTMLNTYQAITGENLLPQMIGVKSNATDRISPTWRRLEDVIRSNLNEHIENASQAAENEALRRLRGTFPMFHYLDQANFHQYLNHISNESPLKQLYIRYRRAIAETTAGLENNGGILRAVQDLARRLDITFPALEALLETTQENIYTQARAALARYPMLELVSFPYGRGPDALFANTVSNYIQLVDSNLPNT